MTGKWLTSEIINKARIASASQEEHITTSLERLSGRSSNEVIREISEHTRMPLFSLNEMESMFPDFNDIDYSECIKNDCLVLINATHKKYFINTNPFDPSPYTWASYKIKGEFYNAFAHPLELKSILSRLESNQKALTQLINLDQNNNKSINIEEISLSTIANDNSQVVRLVNSTLFDAHKSNVSDIHFENGTQGLSIKYRIDGALSKIRFFSDAVLAEQVISRIKVMAELDISEKRTPQDGRFSVSLNGREIDFRVSVMPGMFGEDIVLRILDKQSLASNISKLTLDTLGFDPESKSIIRKLANQPYGMLLVTGPTGSGKTTTLYAVLSEIDHSEDKIITIEDPIEYQLPGILQIPVNEKKGLTFARGLRSILRHDPDRILVGEIRDKETAEIAIQAALTGHQVYTTVHANNSFDVISRFRHMGVDSYSFLSSVNGIAAQRLLRLNCDKCAEPYMPDEQLLMASGIDQNSISRYSFRKGAGCLSCRGTGYKGRFAITELLTINDKLREGILNGTSIVGLKELAIQQGMKYMREQALDAVKQGKTTLQEINRVIFVE